MCISEDEHVLSECPSTVFENTKIEESKKSCDWKNCENQWKRRIK